METQVVIVGAGLAGLTAAGSLQRAGVASVVIDKGRAVGGRMATRTWGDARFDHGAQHFGIRSETFAALAGPWQDDGVMREWYRADGSNSRFVGVGGMRRIPEYLAASLRVRTATTVERLVVEDGSVAAIDGHGERIESGTAAIVTPPLPQTQALLAGAGLQPPVDVSDAFDKIRYRPCLAVMARLDGPAGLAGGHQSGVDQQIAWMADNAHKGTSEVPSVTIHSTVGFALEHLEEDPEVWTSTLAEGATPHLAGRIVTARGHRWRYAEPDSVLELGCLPLEAPVPIVLAGEVFAGARVEGAVLSGRAAADLILERLG